MEQEGFVSSQVGIGTFISTSNIELGGKGVFFSTHITSDLEKIADMLIMIDGGQIVFQEEKDQLLDSYRITKTGYGYQKIFFEYRGKCIRFYGNHKTGFGGFGSYAGGSHRTADH